MDKKIECSGCGIEIREDSEVFCSACMEDSLDSKKSINKKTGLTYEQMLDELVSLSKTEAGKKDFSDWENEFIASMDGKRHLQWTDKQKNRIKVVWSKFLF